MPNIAGIGVWLNINARNLNNQFIYSHQKLFAKLTWLRHAYVDLVNAAADAGSDVLMQMVVEEFAKIA